MDRLRRKMEEAKKTYNTYWESYTKGDLETFASTLDERFEMIGTSESEICHSKAEGIEFLKAQLQEIVGKVAMRNRQIDLLPVENLMLVNEQCDIYVLVDSDLSAESTYRAAGKQDWSFYSRIRISTWLGETDSGWKVIQQHGSLPDMRVQEGETIALEKISKENLELRDAVKRRTAELENKNRELAIEASLEKVRSVAMSMKKPEDMLDVCRVISDQLQQFGVEKIRNVQTAIIDENIGQYLCYQYFTPYVITTVEKTEYLKSPVEHGMVRQMLASRDGHFTGSLSGKELEEFGLHRKEENHFPDPLLDAASEVSYCFLSIGEGGLGLSLYKEMEAGVLELFRRFHRVFSLAYQRFRDIQKAEAQAREAQVEAALERVRSRSMAMHRSDELLEAGEILFSEMQKLGIESLTAGFVLMDKEEKNGLNYTPDPSTKKIMTLPVIIPHNETSHLIRVVENWKKGSSHYVVEMDEEETIKHQTFIAERSTNFTLNAEQLIAISPARLFLHNFYFKEGYLLIVGGSGLSADQIDIMQRFTKVFHQTYTRFLDLQKAEEQARQARIEAALEKVRSRSLAMHNSDELNDVVTILFERLNEFDIHVSAVGISIYIEDSKDWNNYVCGQNETGIAINHYRLPYFDHKIANDFFEIREKGLEFFVGHYTKEEKDSFYEYVIEHSQLKDELPDDIKQFVFQSPSYTISVVATRHAMITINDFEGGSLSEDEIDILKRFSKVFDQAYIRFLDLQKAEAQAREAQIEATLEKVRSRSLAMHKADELLQVATVMRTEMAALGVEELETSSIYTMLDDDTAECWYAIKDVRGKDSSLVFDEMTIDLKDTHVGREMLNFFNGNSSQTSILMKGEQRKEWINYCASCSNVLKGYYGSEIPERTYHLVKFSHGYVGAATPGTISNESWSLLHRMTAVFSMAYTRFLDLQKAEAQAREAQIENALEKVRSRTMAMQFSEELADAAYVLFEQLKSLGVTHERINIGIVNEDNQTIDFWITEQGGDKLNTKFSGRISERTTLSKAYAAWKNGEKSLVVDLVGEELKNWLSYLSDEIKIPFNKAFMHDRRVQTAGFFSKGMLILTSPEPLKPEALYLLEKFAGVFDLTYTRFSDLKLAEAQALQAEKDLIEIKIARQKAEEALTELKATQSQLIQSEKMASLGELTAGIAHEIQNPLNFVNNFSEVSAELLDEVRETRNKRQETRQKTEDDEIEDEILEDIKQNLEKIALHGKRADAIVKGMLEHSKKGSGQKELTDINALAEEFLRLSYQSYLAKNKEFSASLQLNLDPGLPKISVIPQDIGKVLLNLYSNAFYACSTPRPPEGGVTYTPTVTVSTAYSPLLGGQGGRVKISVSDNGSGIPEAIKDKIFQPFFTTKPTGQGTGLGLSLSYDIVKAHGGELKVETKEGVGSEFILNLPIS